MLTGQRVFYPAAALYAALFLPASVIGMGRHGALWHGHEMLFGFALAVVAGNQLGTLSGWRLHLLFAAWAAARMAYLVAPDSLGAAGLNVLFAVLLALHAAPRLFGAAKKWRNQALPAVLVAASATLVAFHLGWKGLVPAVLLFALLMLFMGGRIIAPAIAGQLERQGEHALAALCWSGAFAMLLGLFVSTRRRA